jgi:ABC-type Zn uptake system ZnuABC Zn-binding protein ZnuA
VRRGAVRRRGGGAALLLLAAVLAGAAALAGCGGREGAAGTSGLQVTATATFLSDIAQNVAGDRAAVRSLVPRDADLHAFEPTPRDLAAVSESDLFILNGGGLEETLAETLRSAAPDTTFVEASEGITPREPQPGEPLREQGSATDDDRGDPHYWLDPTLVVTYVRNIRDALVAADPEGEAEYTANAKAYVAQLEKLDVWIEDQVATLPARDRLLVMNHVSHGYFADRYGFALVGAVIPSVGTDDAPTARQLADLTQAIEATGAAAIFVELGQSPTLAQQIAAETGVTVIDDLRDHSLSGPDGEAPTYTEMMKYDTRRIVEALR